VVGDIVECMGWSSSQVLGGMERPFCVDFIRKSIFTDGKMMEVGMLTPEFLCSISMELI
jgi:hypothetical protein